MYILSKEFTLRDYLYKYWQKFNAHLDQAREATQFQQTFTAYITAKSPEKSWYHPMSLRKNNRLLKRLNERAKHTKIDLAEFFRYKRNNMGTLNVQSPSFICLHINIIYYHPRMCMM